MANGISKNPLTDISKVYLNQIAEGSLKNLEKASVLAMSDDPKDQDKAREIKTRFDYQSLMKQKKAKKAVKEDVKRDEYGDPIGGPKISKKQKAKNLKANTPDEQHTTTTSEAFSDWRHDLREIIAADEASDEPEIKEKKIKNKIKINPEFKEAVEELGGELLEVQEVDPKKQEQMKRKEKMLKKRMLRMKLRAVNQTGGEDIVAGHEPEGEIIESRLKKVDECWKTHKQQGYKKKGGKMVPNCVPKNEEVQLEAKYEAGASTYGKASIRNKRRFGTKGENPDPLTGKKITKDATRGELITKRREEHKAKRGVSEATRYAKETGKSFKSGKPVTKGGTAKNDKAFQAVAKKYAGQMMGGPQQKKVRGQKPDESNTPFKRAAARVKQIKMDNKALADKAKKAGYKSTQDYVNVQAVRKGGLGT